MASALAYWEHTFPKYPLCLRSCTAESNHDRFLACHARCRLVRETDPKRAREIEREKEGHGHDDDDEEGSGRTRIHRDPEERAREPERPWEQDPPTRESEEGREGEGEGEGEAWEHHSGGGRRRRNPYHFNHRRSFHTRFQNEHGWIRALQRFDRDDENFRAIRNYRIIEFETRPETLVLPHHSDAEYIVVIVLGKAIFSIVENDNKETYNVEAGDFLRVRKGAIAYFANTDSNQNLRILKLAIPVNGEGSFENFYPAGFSNPKSYYSAFSRETLEATFNDNYDTIQRVVLGNGEREEEEHSSEQQEGVIVKVSREQLRELRRHAKSKPSSKSSSSSSSSCESAPFNRRDIPVRFSNENGKFWEACPEKFPQLQNLSIHINLVDINQGSLLLPHYHTSAIVVAQVVDGNDGELEMGCPHAAKQRSSNSDHQHEDEESEEGQIERLSSRLSSRDVFVIPTGHLVALKSSRNNNLRVVGFALFAENDEINFVGGRKDNVVNNIDKEVKDVSFPGSGQEVERLFGNQKESYFVKLQGQSQSQSQSQGSEGRKEGMRAPLSSILGAFF